jgi:hypothetical protein
MRPFANIVLLGLVGEELEETCDCLGVGFKFYFLILSGSLLSHHYLCYGLQKRAVAVRELAVV